MSINAQKIKSWLKKYPVIAVCGMVSLVLLITSYLRSGLLAEQLAELEKYSNESSKHQANISNAAQLQDQFSFLVQANKAVRDRALTIDGLAQNLQYFYRLEADVGIKYLDLRPGSRPAADSKLVYVPLNYIVSVQGNFSQIISFLRRLEQGSYFCRINTVVASGSDSTVTLNLNLDLLGVQ